MLELIGMPEHLTVSEPNRQLIQHIASSIGPTYKDRTIAEIGVGVGATSLQIAKMLDNNGELHLFDYEDRVVELQNDLAALGFTNVVAHSNTRKHWDSYNWSLGKLASSKRSKVFDFIYLDGAHTLLHDGLAFFLCDKLLKIGGTLFFDDYNWRLSESKKMLDTRHEYMTHEQIETYQVKLVVDLFVKGNQDYSELVEDKIYMKLADRWGESGHS